MSGIAMLNYREGIQQGLQNGRVISLYYDSGKSFEEIAEKVGISIEDVKVLQILRLFHCDNIVVGIKTSAEICHKANLWK